MKKAILIFTVISTMLMHSCGQKETADLVIINGKIFTNDSLNPFVQAIASKGEFITATGTTGDVSRLIGKETQVIDAGGRLVLPGFNDAHVHFGPLDPDYIELRYTTDPSVITEKVKAQVQKSQPGQLIRGGHWEHEMFKGRNWPSKALIDNVSPDNPVILSRADGHSVLVNSFVLKASGITKNTVTPYGGEIQKDPVTGEPTGIIKENAMDLIRTGETKVQLTGAETKEKTRQGYYLALKEARELGVTSIQVPGYGDFDAYDTIMAHGELTSRIDIGGSIPANGETMKKYSELKLKYPSGGNWIRFGYLKAFIDGTIGSGTALMFEPFADNPETSGLSMMPYETFEKMVVEADKDGFQIGVHAIGDKGNNWVLNAYEKAQQVNGKRDSRHRDEHTQTLIQSDIPRFAQLGVIASMQPTHCISDKKFCEKRIGIKRAEGAYAWNSLRKAGARIAFGTDYQVEPLNPMEGLYAAVTRKDRLGEEGDGWNPQEKISMEQAIYYYTIGASYSQFMEERKGILKKGYLADIVITDKDLFTIPENEIMKTKIDYTIVGGKVVYKK
ncbi:MAG TPA: amidohydrolase [Bacteroidales bacterium]|nr:amidohydrolase [Bacteroidales bacterium]